jgi:hypothetical protein
MLALRPLTIALLMVPISAFADGLMTDRFENAPETRWRFFADTVMGGVSTGSLSFDKENGTPFARLTGQVSTDNNGGFIQMRRDDITVPENALGVRLMVRGNDQPYFVHLRTTGTILPWQYYQARFDTTGDWREIRLPFEAFDPSGRLLRASLKPQTVKSIGVVAYGRDHEARVELREVGFYGP